MDGMDGAEGPEGPEGPPGVSGLAGYEIVTTRTNIGQCVQNAFILGTSQCPAGKVLIGDGARAICTPCLDMQGSGPQVADPPGYTDVGWRMDMCTIDSP